MLLQKALPQPTRRLGELLKAIAPVGMQGQYLLGRRTYEGFLFTVLKCLLVRTLKTLASALQIDLLDHVRLQHRVALGAGDLIGGCVHLFGR